MIYFGITSHSISSVSSIFFFATKQFLGKKGSKKRFSLFLNERIKRWKKLTKKFFSILRYISHPCRHLLTWLIVLSPIHRVILVILRYKVMLRYNISFSICFCRRVCKTKKLHIVFFQHLGPHYILNMQRWQLHV